MFDILFMKIILEEGGFKESMPRGDYKFQDLTGQRFGKLTVIERAPNHITKGGNSLVCWKCKCDCGNVKTVTACHLRNGHSMSCGDCENQKHALDDLSGQQFGYLTVLRQAANHVSKGGNSFVAWECVCDCGNNKIVTANHLKTGHTQSCGQCGKFEHNVDFTGRKFGRLTVIGKSEDFYVYPNGDKDFKWICKCDCGNTTVTRGNILRNTRFNQSCGCWRKEESIIESDMLNKRFGKCVVLSKADRIYVNATATVDAWNCLCDCGNKFVARGPQLRFGNLISCGCASKSKWEIWLSQYLDEHGYNYESQKFYSDLRGVGDGYLTYDFCVHIDKIDVLIECQGPQHYKPISVFGGEDAYKKQIVHDTLKRKYAYTHGIKLIEIDCSKRMSVDDYFNMLNELLEQICYK